RTAKFAISKKTDVWQHKKYKTYFGMVTLVEIFLGLYFSGSVVYAFIHGLWMSLYSLLFFQVGFLYVGLLSLFQGRPALRLAPNLSASSVPIEQRSL
ncbi:MAG TPA: hypothetical protein DF383_06560, partial [Deltaproteobacteria bacterium]|nr:hypothetical protein [Deltaproteobacteria bacterium]